MFSFSNVFASPKLNALRTEDLSSLESGVACWLNDFKKNKFIYDDLKHAVIKLEDKVIKLNHVSGNWDSGFYSCGKSYKYASDDKKIEVSVVMEKARKGICLGALVVKSSTSEFKIGNLDSNCGS